MSGPFQVGDIIAIATLAKRLFEFGWEGRYSSSRKYNEFGQDVDALRYNLDLLATVIQSADSKLYDLTYSRTAALRWDARSLGQIIGDCWKTIYECEQLLSDNSNFVVDAGPLRNIQWHLMVQDDVDALQVRIQQHTNKIHLALAPFEIDLLTSIGRLIQEMHADVLVHIQEVRRDVQEVRREVLRLQGVVVPELQQGLDRQEAQTNLLPVPAAIRDRLEHIYNTTTTRDASLSDLADAFVTHFYESTYPFQPMSRIARDRVPPDKAYLNLIKCIWLIEKLKESEEYQNIPEGSHWTSYLAELEKVLSDECRRFEDDLVTPSQPTLSDEHLRIWRRENRSSTVIIPREAELVLSTRVIQRATENDEQQELKLQLLRYLDETNGQEFTINLYGRDDGNPLVNSLDFNLRTAVLIPRYVVGDSNAGSQRLLEPSRPRGMWSSPMFRRPESDNGSSSTLTQQLQGPYRVTLGRGPRFETFNFKRLKDAMAFQHAITGYLVQGPKSFTANVTFVFSNQGPRVPRYRAYVQVWYPMRKEADLSSTGDGASRSTLSPERASSSRLASSPRSSMTAFNIPARGGLSTNLRDPFGQMRRDTRDTIRSGADRWPNRQTSLNSLSPTDAGRSPPRLGAFQFGRGSELSRSPDEILLPRIPRDGPNSGLGERPASLTQQSQASSRRTSIFSTARSRARSSVTSIRTDATTGGGGSSSSSGSASTLGVDTGGGITGTLHTPPPKPMVVILIDDQDAGERSIVTLDLPTSEVRPDLCDCRRGDHQGRSCRDVCLEVSRQGPAMGGGGDGGMGRRGSFLQARILKPTTTTTQSSASADYWDLSRLAYTRRHDASAHSSGLANLNRVTISFDRAADRVLFSGDVHCGCANRGRAGLETDRQRRECVRANHRGIVGQAKEFYLKELRAYEGAEAARTHVVNGPRPND